MFKFSPFYFLPAISVFLWSLHFIIARHFVAIVDPISLAYLRWTLVWIFLFPFAINKIKTYKKVLLQNKGLILLVSILGMTNFNTFLYIGIKTTLATNALLFMAPMPLFIVAISRLLLRSPLSFLQIVGLLLSTIGIFFIVARGDWNNFYSLNFNTGDIWILLAALTWAFYSVLLKKIPSIAEVVFLFVSVSITLIVLFPFMLWERLHSTTAIQFSQELILALCYMSLGASIIAYFCWNSGIKKLGVSTVGYFIYLQPIFGTLMAYYLLDERIHLYHFIAIICIFIGITIAFKFRKR